MKIYTENHFYLMVQRYPRLKYVLCSIFDVRDYLIQATNFFFALPCLFAHKNNNKKKKQTQKFKTREMKFQFNFKNNRKLYLF